MSDWFAATNILSGIALLLMAWGLSWTQDRALRRGLAAFIMTWGVQVVLSNVADLTPNPAFLRHLALILIALQPITLLYFVFLLRPEGRLTKWNRQAFHWLLASLVAGGLALFVLVVAPSALIGEGTARWGPLAPLVLHIPQFLAYVVAFVLMAKILSASPDPQKGRLLFIGLWLPIAAATSFNAALVVFDFAGYAVHAGSALNASVYFVLLPASLIGQVVAALIYAKATRQVGLVSAIAAVPVVWTALAWLLPAAITGSAVGQIATAPGIYRLLCIVPLAMYAWGARSLYPPLESSAATWTGKQFVPTWSIPAVTLCALAFLLPIGGERGAEIYGPALAVATGVANLLWFLSTDGAAPVRDLISYES